MLCTLFLPLFGFLVVCLFGRVLGRVGVFFVLLSFMGLSVCINFYIACLVVTTNTSFIISVGAWVSVFEIAIMWEFLFDFVSCIMLAMVSIVSWLVHIYSISYMRFDPHLTRFLSYLSIFTFFMYLLVSSGNLVQLFLGWEGVGLCSFILISFWSTRLQAGKAAIKAVLMNRVGDVGFIVAVAILFELVHSTDITVLPVILSVVPTNQEVLIFSGFLGHQVFVSIVDLIAFFFLLGVVGKSAQLSLHTWLPAAMEGPTPVSALIHAATMVTAGIYLLIRCSFIFDLSENVRILIVVIGAGTAIFSALTACFLFDIKKIIAYSTCSQLGYMFLAGGLSQYSYGLFHLINHAFFKALLFLCAGALLHLFANEQDMRNMTLVGIRSKLLIAIFVVGSIAIAGLPFLAGFYSKDIIIESLVTNFGQSGWYTFVALTIFIATGATAYYSCRVVYFLVFKQGGTNKIVHLRFFSLQPALITGVLIVLAWFSIFVGYFFWEIFSFHSGFTSANFWDLLFDAEYSVGVDFIYKNVPLFVNCCILFGFVLILLQQKLFFVWFRWSQMSLDFWKAAQVGYKRATVERSVFKKWWSLLLSGSLFNGWVQGCIYILNFYAKIMTSRWFVWLRLFGRLVRANYFINELYNYWAISAYFYSYTAIFKNVDKGGLEIFGPTGISWVYTCLGKFVSRLIFKSLQQQIFAVYAVVLVYLYLLEFIVY